MNEDISDLIYFILFVFFVVLLSVFLESKQDETTRPQSKYVMDDYGNFYSVQPCPNRCNSCFEFHKVDTAEIKVKTFDFVPR